MKFCDENKLKSRSAAFLTKGHAIPDFHLRSFPLRLSSHTTYGNPQGKNTKFVYLCH